MSTFLPYIKDSSSEEAVFKALIKRAKGSNANTIANLFSIVLNLGIEKTRTKLDSYSSNLTTSAKIKELISDNTDLHVQKSEMLFWACVMDFERTTDEPHPSFDKDELEIFFSVLVTCKPESLADAGFHVDHAKYLDCSKQSFDVPVAHIKGVSITEKDAQRTGFSCWEEFKAYLAHISSTETNVKIMPVFIQADIRNISQAEYENRHCISPYNRN